MLNNDFTIGILGGMGPYATARFFLKILDLTNAEKDWEHFHLVIDNNTHIPSRSRAYLYGEKSPVDEMISSCNKLAEYPVNIIALPCNSAAYFLDKVQKNTKIPILNIINITSELVSKLVPRGSKIAVWGSIITYTENTYKKPLEALGLSYVNHSNETQMQVMSFIEEIKKNNSCDRTQLISFINDYVKEYRPDKIILGCTEFACIAPEAFGEMQDMCVDSSSLYASYLVNLAKSRIK